ncbi:hypothetical protein [Harryflintia acetispora]|uniref:hypothetical protein n=1 Tax=Harryflintia acetispora TaxID=1849041 RepID=UPI001898C43F|nr:hypothetical protein [Harryflintia acetispora]
MKQEFMKLLRALVLCTCLCLVIAATEAVLLRTPFLAGQKAFLYRLLAITALCSIALLLVSGFIFRKKYKFFQMTFSESVLCIGMASVFMALFFTLGPMTIERSYTIYSLADMADHGGQIYSADEIKNRFIEGYIGEANESQKRIDEQVYIGNLEETDGGYKITEKGERLVRIFRFLESIFPVPDKNSIYPNGQ